jgi:hypothetical protein
VNADFYNLQRKAINLTSLLRWDADKRRLAVNLSGPLNRSRYRVAIDVRDERWDLSRTVRGSAVNGVNVRKAEAGAEGVTRLSGRFNWTLGLWASGRQFRSAEAGRLFEDGWLAELRNRLDVRLLEWPEHRLRVDGWAQLRTGRWITGGADRFVSPQVGASSRWFPQAAGEKYELSAQARAGGVFGRVPLDEMYVLGMERDNDLWLRGHVGTRDGRKGNAPLGSRFLLVNLDAKRELLRAPFLRVQAGPFFDFGGTRDPGGRVESRGMLYDAGVQVTLATLGGVRVLAVYGRDLRGGRPAVYTAVLR